MGEMGGIWGDSGGICQNPIALARLTVAPF